MSAGKIFKESLIKSVAAGDESALLYFDRQGLLPAPGEDAPAFAEKLTRLASALAELDSELKKDRPFEAAPGIRISSKDAIPENIYDEALKITGELYEVKPAWVPGFFANESFGALWGGCALSDPVSKLTLFIIRKAFARRRRWLVYDRRELMAHEMIHASHQAFDDWMFEEYFAYRSAGSALRKFFGGCFIQKYDAMCFLIPVLLLPLVQFLNLYGVINLPMWIFWIIAAVYPVYLTLRCSVINFTAYRARKFLQANHIAHPDAVLFRLTAAEIRSLARGIMVQGNDLRWQIIRKRFF